MKKLIIAISSLAVMGALASILLILGLTSPEYVLAQAAKKTAKLTSVHVSGTMIAAQPVFSPYDFLHRVTAPAARLEELGRVNPVPTAETIAMDADVDMRAFADLAVDARLTLEKPEQTSTAGDVRFVGGRLFIRFDGVPLDGRRAQPGFVGNWYEMTRNPSLAARPEGSVPFFLTAYTADEEAAYRRMIATIPLLVPSGPISTATVAGRRAWIIPVRGSVDGAVAWNARQQEVFHGVNSTPTTLLPSDAQGVQQAHGTVTVDQQTYDVLAFQFSTDAATLPVSPFGPGSIDLSFSHHNQAVDIQAPERFQPITAFDRDAPPALAPAGTATPTPGGTGQGAENAPLQPASSTPYTLPPTPSSTDDTDRDGLTDALEAFYGSDPHNPDTDGDGVTDGAEVAAGRDPAGPGLLYEFRGSATSTP